MLKYKEDSFLIPMGIQLMFIIRKIGKQNMILLQQIT